MENVNEIDKLYHDLITSYLNIKPVLANIKSRNDGVLPDGILNELRAINDHLARCFRDGMDEQYAIAELHKADGHIKRLIFDSFKQLNIIFYDYTETYEKKYFGVHWISIRDGEFWKNFSAFRNKVFECIESAKILESVDTMASLNEYQEAYAKQERIYELLEENRSQLEVGVCKKSLDIVSSNKGWMWSTIVLAVVPAAIWETIRNWTAIEEWIKSLIQ